ncbi:uncharacterized protein [Brachionichthys hirsutus]|uniref:uncharacterized protein n=1 Tax=Brachionichthys hirsutus TaxID=412623 RepID=UPI00360537BE
MEAHTGEVGVFVRIRPTANFPHNLIECLPDGQLSLTSRPLSSSPPPKDEAFECFKVGQGSEINAVFKESKAALLERRDLLRQLGEEVNAVKRQIDSTAATIQQYEELTGGRDVQREGRRWRDVKAQQPNDSHYFSAKTKTVPAALCGVSALSMTSVQLLKLARISCRCSTEQFLKVLARDRVRAPVWKGSLESEMSRWIHITLYHIWPKR